MIYAPNDKRSGIYEEERSMSGLFDIYQLGDQLLLKNRVVMAPMTRTRTSDGDVPNALMAKYYAQRASAGLIVTEATDVSAHSKGYARTPGIYTEAQVEGWRLVTDEVHRNGGTIFSQIWHVGRMAHTSMMPNGEAPWGVTDERAESDVFAHDSEGKLTFMRASSPRQDQDRRDRSCCKGIRTGIQECEAGGLRRRGNPCRQRVSVRTVPELSP